MKALSHISRYLIKIGAILFIIIGPGGFLWFCSDTLLKSTPQPDSLPTECDGIVALTGGKDRITTSLYLLEKHPSLQLLISGVAPHAQLNQIVDLRAHPISPQLLPHITLGRRAISTVGNARETADWAHHYQLSHLTIVTADYHMRRAMIEFHELAPGIQLFPYPVKPEDTTSLWHRHTWRILAREYIKLLGAFLRSVIHAPQRPYDLSP
ncbi:YdcF family protein [Saccharibacter sp. 17.LH.SD]|uniref:YdcF family protein n=1 Tax=Saccharibacter sp. 17.LH.SD TaxID=2689393 RepID=UPI00136FE6B9|nr:YdcF family protein [Saccharibacter sp. 17.LH.SD]MXV44753.1 YdcF family protein [Saccharibacter sp. 17.LH.SD]